MIHFRLPWRSSGGILGVLATEVRDAVTGTDFHTCTQFQLNPFSTFIGDWYRTDRHTDRQTDKQQTSYSSISVKERMITMMMTLITKDDIT